MWGNREERCEDSQVACAGMRRIVIGAGHIGALPVVGLPWSALLSRTLEPWVADDLRGKRGTWRILSGAGRDCDFRARYGYGHGNDLSLAGDGDSCCHTLSRYSYSRSDGFTWDSHGSDFTLAGNRDGGRYTLSRYSYCRSNGFTWDSHGNDLSLAGDGDGCCHILSRYSYGRSNGFIWDSHCRGYGDSSDLTLARDSNSCLRQRCRFRSGLGRCHSRFFTRQGESRRLCHNARDGDMDRFSSLCRRCQERGRSGAGAGSEERVAAGSAVILGGAAVSIATVDRLAVVSDKSMRLLWCRDSRKRSETRAQPDRRLTCSNCRIWSSGKYSLWSLRRFHRWTLCCTPEEVMEDK
ncbi:uncharacterized protein EI97DRAFT_305787 [Westerdykella ornata]|uniref:Uncharacterized protein n=1 Tax=Westerdykella ornata TaxID=318751 RepID=A0A6A6JMX6_WESOR|nr:uncharacterized protein EI97DRAFT_305787 [Westerdykella ornata]KAF2277006.1 hypothetical protein EI97DRAFT_305787 [Westerdykella ornata]